MYFYISHKNHKGCDILPSLHVWCQLAFSTGFYHTISLIYIYYTLNLVGLLTLSEAISFMKCWL